jgi:hypothetical protein
LFFEQADEFELKIMSKVRDDIYINYTFNGCKSVGEIDVPAYKMDLERM